MSIRTEDKPKAFETVFMSTSGAVQQYGAFNFKPGEIVRKKKMETTDETHKHTWI